MEGSFFDALGSVQRFATKISWNTNYQYHLNKPQLCTVNMRSCVTYTNWFMACPFFQTLVTPLPPLSLTPLTLAIIFLYMCPPPTQMPIITPFFVIPYVRTWTHYLTLLCHYLALKGLYLITYNYCCACTLLFLTLGCILVRINTTLLLFMYPLSFGMNYYRQKNSGFLLTFFGFEHTVWLVMHSSYTNRRGIGKLLATDDKYTVAIQLSKNLSHLVFLSSQLPALVQ